uniref:Transthyretin-like family protein n=1 Tax=Angiostrongylus cantonensis TaxID=6313 RepID=A0A158PAB3_ANGCA
MTKIIALRRPDGTVKASIKAVEKSIDEYYSDLFNREEVKRGVRQDATIFYCRLPECQTNTGMGQQGSEHLNDCAMSRLFAVGSLLFVGAALRDQSIAVKGRLICGANPAADVLVKLWDEDIDVNAFSWLDPHDLLDFNYSNSNGEFELAGATTEFTAMEPVLSVYHDCNDGIKSGQKFRGTIIAVKFCFERIVKNANLTCRNTSKAVIGDSNESGVRKFSIGLPDHYITAGKTPLKTVDIGIINLELSYKEEQRVDDDEEEILTK